MTRSESPPAPGAGQVLPPRTRSVFAERDFRTIFVAELVSLSGNQLTVLAVPVVAISVLGASTTEVGILGALSTAAFLVVGLPAGAWVDRADDKRRTMIVADLVRAAVLATVPLAWSLGALTTGQLYVVVLAVGAATVFFDLAAMSIVPAVVPREMLVEANSRLGSLTALSEIAGQGLGGLALRVLSAPVALAVDVVSYLWSAAWLLRVRVPTTTRRPSTGRALTTEMRDGIRHVAAHRVLRAIAVEGTVLNLSVQVCLTVLPLVVLRGLGRGPAALGAYLALGSGGVLVGSLVARRVAERVGYGRALWGTGLVLAPAAFLVPLIGPGPWFWVSAAGWSAVNARVGLNTVLKVSLRQHATPAHLLGRMNACFRFLLTGALAVGAGLVALLSTAGVADRSILWIGSGTTALTWLLLCGRAVRATTDLAALPAHDRTES